MLKNINTYIAQISPAHTLRRTYVSAAQQLLSSTSTEDNLGDSNSDSDNSNKADASNNTKPINK